MDVSMSRTQLCYKALENLGVLATGQTPSDDEVAKVDALVDPVVADLAARDIYLVDDAGQLGPANGQIEPAAFLWLAHCVAFQAAPSFGCGDDPVFGNYAAMAELRLKTIGRPARSRRNLKVDAILYRGTRRYPGTYNPTTGR
jgi:hypothetical protein